MMIETERERERERANKKRHCKLKLFFPILIVHPIDYLLFVSLLLIWKLTPGNTKKLGVELTERTGALLSSQLDSREHVDRISPKPIYFSVI